MEVEHSPEGSHMRVAGCMAGNMAEGMALVQAVLMVVQLWDQR